jgi:hypothetical protein
VNLHPCAAWWCGPCASYGSAVWVSPKGERAWFCTECARIVKLDGWTPEVRS